MLLAHLLPFLDAEIDRLQQARDLLAYSPPAEQAPAPMLLDDAALLPLDQVHEPEALRIATVQPAVSFAAPDVAPPPRVTVLKPHGPGRGGHYGRRRVAPAFDTALRSSVPAGPIVVSAEEVRRAQAGKGTASAAPAANPMPSFTWRPPARNKGDVDALLRKLMDLGRKDDSAGIRTAPVGLG